MSRPLPEKGRLCAIVVSYFPDARFAEYLRGIQTQCDSVIIVDNGSSGPSRDLLRGLHGGRVCLHEMGRNTGLGAALNQGIAQARGLGYPWVLLFDQDSLPLADMAACFAGILAVHPRPERIALIGSRFIDRNRESPPSPQPAQGPAWSEQRRVITSGMLLALDAYDDIGPFREDFFIDTIDHDFCYRARRKGWLILKTDDALLSHSVGHYRRHRFLGLEVWRSHHSALRCYFMTRNPMILAREERAYAKLARGAVKALKNAFLVLLLEEDKAGKIRATLAGCAHGLAGRTAMPAWIRRMADQRSGGTPEG
ncbi:MAG: glycosyltransferase family 2 protein [Rhodocyclaceae bacterium]|nr:glycosyltransferase family 2 protein [Rhodocyclaceae bacterium]